MLLAVLEGSYRAALITTLIMALISLSLVVVTGYCGQISLAQMTFAGAAAFLLSRFTSSWNLPFPVAVLLASAVAAIVGVVIGLPALRIRGLLVGVVTLSLAVTRRGTVVPEQRLQRWHQRAAPSPARHCSASTSRSASDGGIPASSSACSVW